MTEPKNPHIECPGCTCSEECEVYLDGGKTHWFTTEGSPGYVICEFCNIEIQGEVEL